MKKFFQISLVLFLMSVSCNIAKAQDFALKTNVLYDATATINLGAEVGLAPKWTFDLSGNYNHREISEMMNISRINVTNIINNKRWYCEEYEKLKSAN